MANILILEDQALLAKVISSMVEMAGHSVSKVCHDPQSALEAVDGDSPDLMLLDIGMPGEMDGIEMLRRARSRGYSGKVVFLSAYTEDIMADRLSDVEYSRYLTKPVNDSILGSVLSEVLAE
jgi:CheY-like chemotaxis protein